MRYFIIPALFLLFLLPACTSGSPGDAVPESTPSTNTPDLASIPDDPDPGGLPDGWRDDVPLMPGFTVKTFDASHGGMIAMSEGDVPIDEVTDFYSAIDGWVADTGRDWVTTGSRRALMFTSSEWKLTVTISVSDDKTNLTIMVVA